MDLAEYTECFDALTEHYKRNKKDLAIRFAKSNNKVKIGDIITDHFHTIVVEKIEYTFSSTGYDVPSCVYHGEHLKKNGERRKKKEQSEVHQVNLIKINGVSV